MKNKKGNFAVIALIIIVVAIVASAGGWFAKKSQTPVQQAAVSQSAPVAQTQPSTSVTQSSTQSAPVDETANWQTFTNAKYGIEFKYPAGYEAKIDENENSGNPLFYVKNAEKDVRISGDGPYPIYAFSLNIMMSFLGGDPDKFQTPEEWAKNQKKSDNTIKEETINRIAMYTADTTTGGGQKLKENYMFVKKGNVYDFYTITYKKSDVGQKILSTLEFTN